MALVVWNEETGAANHFGASRLMIIAALMAIAQPAVACHRFHIWKYPWPQRCSVAGQVHARVVTTAPQPLPIPRPKEPSLPLPALEWVAQPDCPEEIRGRLLLRVKLNGGL